MHIPNKKESLILLLGDIVAFALSLWLSLWLRYGEIPSTEIFLSLLTPFAILSVLWIIAFFIAGLYEKQRIARRNRLPELLLKTQAFNSVLAIAFFYFLPFFGVAPKIILFIYIALCFVFTFLWRNYALHLFGSKKRDNAMLIGRGADAHELKNEINGNPRYNFQIAVAIDTSALDSIDFNKDILERIYQDDISIIVIDSYDEKVAPILPHLYNLIFSQVQFIDLYRLYEEIFDRIPLSLVRYSWFLENISLAPHVMYDAFKRLMDVVVSIIGVIISSPFFIFSMALLTIEGGGIWSFQERVGEHGKIIRLIKFRTMTYANAGDLVDGRKNEVTKIGKFLRKARIDELPQFFNVIKGDISLVGPRPEFPKAVAEYAKVIPYYGVRHIIKPGLSGWAQIYHENHPHHGIDIKETQNKLSYDLFYIKNRSFTLDIIIALKTIKTLLSREGI